MNSRMRRTRNARTPIKTQAYSDFDEFNIPAVETVRVRDIPGPQDQTVAGFTRTTQTDYAASRAALAALGIVNAGSERRVLTGTRLLSRESFTYLPDFGGRMGSRKLEVFSGLGDVPAPLEGFRTPLRALTKAMGYDVFGNITEMSDDFGQTEAVTYDETGTLAISHTKFAGSTPELDQVTTMTYDGSRKGAVDTMTTPLGMVVSQDYDALGRKIREVAADGAEKVFNYKIGENGLPSLILTSKRRYPSPAATPRKRNRVD